jgi:hypothetical protein
MMLLLMLPFFVISLLMLTPYAIIAIALMLTLFFQRRH